LYQGDPIHAQITPDDAHNVPTGCNLRQTFSYAWSISAQPAGSTATFNNPTAASPSFTPDVAGEYDLQVTLTDSTGRSTTTPMRFRSGTATDAVGLVGVCGGSTPSAVPATTAPVPSVSGDTSVGGTLNTPITFDASGSSD